MKTKNRTKQKRQPTIRRVVINVACPECFSPGIKEMGRGRMECITCGAEFHKLDSTHLG